MQASSSSAPFCFTKWGDLPQSFQQQEQEKEQRHQEQQQQQQQLPIPIPPLSLLGRSRAMDGTSILLPELKWRLDAGALIQPQCLVHHIFLTHTHADHVSQLPQLLLVANQNHYNNNNNNNNNQKGHGTKIYLPTSAVPHVQHFLTTFQVMTRGGGAKNTMSTHHDDDDDDDDDENNTTNDHDHEDEKGTLTYELIPCQPGDVLWIKEETTKSKLLSKIQYRVEVLQCDHRIDCIGFAIWKRQEGVLKPEYQQMTKPERSILFQKARHDFNNNNDKARQRQVEQDREQQQQQQVLTTNHTQPHDTTPTTTTTTSRSTTTSSSSGSTSTSSWLDPFQMTVTTPLICLLGDTTHKVFEWHANQLLRQGHVVIVVECTYLGIVQPTTTTQKDDETTKKKQATTFTQFNTSTATIPATATTTTATKKEDKDGNENHPRNNNNNNNNIIIMEKEEQNAKRRKHIHWNQLRPIVEQHPNILFVLIHFSLKYSSLQIRTFFANYPNVHPMLVESELEYEWRKQCQQRQPHHQQQEEAQQQEAQQHQVPFEETTTMYPPPPPLPKCGCRICQLHQ
jgi:ribonuclease BN (tRNA processing enzyme)